MRRLHSLLVLGRVSNLPTVWSNCLAAWWLGGGGNAHRLPFLFAGVTLLYLGGMYWNDAFDVEFDRAHRPERPIPSGKISESAVWRIGLALLGSGAACLLWLGNETGLLGAVLLSGIVLYDATHKFFPFAPALMGLCRFLVYLIAASTGAQGVTGWAIWCGLALMLYVVGLSCVARRESTGVAVPRWPIVLLATPIGLAWILNTGDFRRKAFLLSAILALWIVRSLGRMLWDAERRIDRAISGLLAGIVFVDLLAVPDIPLDPGAFFLLFFLTTLLLQRVVPAT